jgi:hypothetical protein
MTPLVKKILEAGLVDKHTAALMEHWGTLDAGAVDLVDKKKLTEKNLEQFVEDIEALISPDVPMHETMLDQATGRRRVMVQDLPPYPGAEFVAIDDPTGKLIIPPEIRLHRGEYIRGSESIKNWLVEDVVPIYVGDHLSGYRVTVNRE